PLIFCRITLPAGTRTRSVNSDASDQETTCVLLFGRLKISVPMGIFILISLFVGIIDQASASPVLETILERRLQRVRESGKGGRAVVRIRGVTDDVAAAFVRLLYAGSRYRLCCFLPGIAAVIFRTCVSCDPG
uniref:Uncharacterized protein n=1 Tax=Aegilops tauschii subsp. strangulata TaxID=200361 RepID=A0A453G8P9_AEGTS